MPIESRSPGAALVVVGSDRVPTGGPFTVRRAWPPSTSTSMLRLRATDPRAPLSSRPRLTATADFAVVFHRHAWTSRTSRTDRRTEGPSGLAREPIPKSIGPAALRRDRASRSERSTCRTIRLLPLPVS